MEGRRADQVRGCLFGGALGDALGLYTEMVGRDQAQEMWGKLGGLQFEGWEDREHTRQFQRGDWTDDTDLSITIIDSLLASSGQVDLLDLQRRAQDWLQHGFPELGDTSGLGTGSTITTSLTDPAAALGPKAAALLTWAEMGGFDLGTSGAVMRIAPVAVFLHGREGRELVQGAVDVGAITHADPRSVSACVSIVVAISSLLQDSNSETAANKAQEAGLAALQAYTSALPALILSTSELLAGAGFAERGRRLVETFQAAYPAIQQRSSAELFQACFHHSQLSSVPEICTFSRDYAYKILAIAMWALRQERSYEDVVLEIVREGGDADTNAAVAGAVYGAKVGLSGLPERLLSGLVHKDWLAHKADLITLP